ncbi:site-specific integrase [Variovorax sp. YR216]|uniref:tyrosine-type recombinase/integrase n=1 Tax=Variovorax sp. YR216 TaxID=1882828 RepID=UPI0008957E1C|nr:site-specific integrase [Variovorax sp. YR216]SEB22691.1 Phage integrase family protein [Variovorax sp. YR216]
MLETLFRNSRVLARHLDGPAAEERDCFVAHFAASGATRDSVANLASELLVVAQRLDDSGTRNRTPEEVASVADRWVRHHRRRGRSISPDRRQRFVQVATDWLRFLGRLQLPPSKPGAGTDLVDEFALYMQRERGLSPKTVNNRCWHVRAFLTWLDDQHSGAGMATLEHVDAFLSMRGAQGWCRASIATAATALRSFYTHMAATSRCAESFVAGIEGPRLFRQEALPAGPCWNDFQRLIASAATDRPRDIRDRVVLMLLRIYGLRSGEVVALTLDDIDWERDILHVARPKQRCKHDYPLATEVGNAILRYVREVRPRCASRKLFLTTDKPWPIQAITGYHQASVLASRKPRSSSVWRVVSA